ncbi:MAG TPA: hypothetical protein VFX98_07675 [Longimicrobiaceae bacterium]|nr:hypothetical protein [Longimicrobiaceae bacterium]
MLRDRRGVALPLALLALVAVSLMVTTALVTSTTESAISSAQQGATQGLYGADAAVEGYVASRALLVSDETPQPLQPVVASAYTSPAGSAFSMTVARLRSVEGEHPDKGGNWRQALDTYSILAEAERGRSVGALYTTIREFHTGELNLNAGASIGADKVKLPGNSATLSGDDTSHCNTGDVVGLMIAAGVDISALSQDKVVGGIDTTEISKADFAHYLLSGMSPEELADLAEIKWGEFTGGRNLSGFGKVDAANARSSGLNWGCPLGIFDSCKTDVDTAYFPVVAIRPPKGTTVKLQGFGQGVLIVLGNAHFNANFKFQGVVVVVGELQVNGGTNVFGALVALGDVTLSEEAYADAGGEQTTFNGQSLVQFDRCQLNRAQDALNKRGDLAPQQFSSGTFAWFEVLR